ncbi:MAG TPA: VirB8/TrbF family protein [Allosphingosinicella sp.]|jgi:type IV secretion system protein VirB8
MNKRSRENLEGYYREAESWASDRQEGLRKSRKMAWIVAGIASAVALLEAGALILLAPLKTVVPYTLLVDRQTGFVQAVRPLEAQQIAGDTALTQSFLVQYVVKRESYDFDQVQANYRDVTLWSAEAARAQYIAMMQASNPESPLNRYPRNSVVETHVKSVSPVARNVAMVRFETRLRRPDGQTAPIGAYVAVLRYRFSAEPVSQEDRFENPLGFQVVRYRRDQEALAPADPQQQGTPGAQTPAMQQPPAGQQAPTMVVPGQQPQRAPVQVQPPQRRQPPQRVMPEQPRPEVEL